MLRDNKRIQTPVDKMVQVLSPRAPPSCTFTAAIGTVVEKWQIK